MPTSGANQVEAVEVGVGKFDALVAGRLSQAEAVRVGDAAVAAPPVYGAARRTHGQGQAFDDVLHSGILAIIASECQAGSLATSAVGRRRRLRYVGDMPKKAADQNPENAAMAVAFGKRVRLARDAAVLTQEQLAELIGMDGKSVSNWERGLQFMYAPDLYRLAGALKVTTDWLLGGDPRMLTVDMQERLCSPKARKRQRKSRSNCRHKIDFPD